MESLAQTLAWIIAGLILGQAALLFAYARFLYRFRRPALADDECPRAAVILCVRGLDPFLPACLTGLFRQDYPDYDVWIVVDSTRDAAWPVVNELARQSGKHEVHVLTLTERLATCTRKMAGMLQAMSNIDASHEIVALLDSDTIPHAAWLRELAAPLADPRVGVSSGNRWYMPAAATAGSLVRYLWNVAAVVQMYWYDIGWGGSLAIQGEVPAAVRSAAAAGQRLQRRHHHLPLCRGTRISGCLLAVAGDGESGNVQRERRVWFPAAAIAGRADAQFLVVGSGCPWRRHDRRARACLPAGRGCRDHRQLDCRGLDRHGAGRLLGLDGRAASSLGVVRTADRAASRRNDQGIWGLGLVLHRDGDTAGPDRTLRRIGHGLLCPHPSLARRAISVLRADAGPRG